MENIDNYYLLAKSYKKWPIYSVFFILTLIFIFFAGYFFSAILPVSKDSNFKNIEIKQNEGFRQISIDLEKDGIIRSSFAFQLLSLLSGSAHKLKPGSYSLDAAMSAPNILRAIVAGPDLEREVLIPPGFTLLDIDKKLSDAGVLALGDLAKFNPETIKNAYEFLSTKGGSASDGKELKSLVNLEGYLFPDTYNFFIKSSPDEVVKKILDNFNNKAWPLLKGKNIILGNSILSPQQILIVASLIEKEVYFDSDRPIVAGIIYNRLKIGMPLQIDAAIAYAKCHGFMFYCSNPVISKTEIKYNSSYNYSSIGLPPGPIGNPGLKSIEAALNPQESDYFYYISDPKTHKIIFSKNFEEQNENIVKYLGI
jgi:UPF0755 protein